MLMSPARQRVVDVHELFGKLVKLIPAIGIAVDLKPGLSERLDRAVADLEARPCQCVDRAIPQARLIQRFLQTCVRGGARIMMFKEARIFEPEAIFELAELRR